MDMRTLDVLDPILLQQWLFSVKKPRTEYKEVHQRDIKEYFVGDAVIQFVSNLELVFEQIKNSTRTAKLWFNLY